MLLIRHVAPHLEFTI